MAAMLWHNMPRFVSLSHSLRPLTKHRLATSTRCRSGNRFYVPIASRNLPQKALYSTKTATSTAATGNEANNNNNSNVFLDNLGAIFLGGIGLIIGALVRSYYGSTNRNKMREQLAELSSLDPLEIDDLRIANSELTLPVFRKIMEDLKAAFPSNEATYADVIRTVRTTMAGLKGDAFTIELGHLIDRVVIDALKSHSKTTEDPQPMGFWLTVISLGLHAPVPERIQALFEVMKTTRGENVTMGDVKSMIVYLQDTCQLVPDSQVIPSAQKYPIIQQYERGTGGQLFEWDGTDADLVDVDAFAEILRSTAVCAWGECYHRKKFS